MNPNQPPHWWTHLTTDLQDTALRVQDRLQGMVQSLLLKSNGDSNEPDLNQGASDWWLLGVAYQPQESESNLSAFQSDFESRFWFTYRQGFPAFDSSDMNSDTGWGCMVRCGQSLLSQALSVHLLGRQWRLNEASSEAPVLYKRLIWWFLDLPDSSEHLFSIHQLVQEGRKLDVPVGQWYGPTTIAQAIQVLVNRSLNVIKTVDGHDLVPLQCFVSPENTIYKQQIIEDLFQGWSENQSLLLLIPLRLGVDQLNPIYYSAIKETFHYPQTIGIAGGKPLSALHFIGYVGNSLFYLDPHHPRPAITPVNGSISKEDLMSYHCKTVRRTHIKVIDPSVLVGFYCKNRAEFDNLCQRLEASKSKFTPIITVSDRAPEYDDSIDIQSEASFNGNDDD